MNNKIKLYMMGASQPARAVQVTCEYMNIPYEPIMLNFNDLSKPEYTKINPDQKVPCIVDQDQNLVLNESHTIMRYLVSKKQNQFDYLYPSQDALKRARIDQYLDWHHQGTRSGARYLFAKVYSGWVGVKPISDNLKELKRQADKALNYIETVFLKDGKFIQGFEEITLADISCFCDLKSLEIADIDLKPYTNIYTWMQKMEKLPAIQKTNVIHNKILKRVQKQNQQQKPKL